MSSLSELAEPNEVPSPVPVIETDDEGNTVDALKTNGHSKHHHTNGYFGNGHSTNGNGNGTVTPSYIDSMAHLSVVRARDDSDAASVRSTSSRASRRPQMQLTNYQDEFTTSVYGSRFAGMDLPRHHMPEGEMPRDIAYRMIKDDLSLDNNPMLK
ncbi:hypothetical protein ACJZ2D_015666 [Fusarium nematophilum]